VASLLSLIESGKFFWHWLGFLMVSGKMLTIFLEIWMAIS
jgi:hypothetical protein